MNLQMQGKVALITGGSSGIGKATAIAFAAEDVKVAIASRDKTKADDVIKSIEGLGGEAIWISTDVTQSEQVKNMVAQTVNAFGRLDFAFNNAGTGGKGGLTAEISEDDWQKTIHGYLTSVWLCMKYEIPEMLKTGGGAIVNNASVDGLRAFPFPVGSSYSAAKHGVIGLTKSSALEYITKGIRINVICPGWVDTPPVQDWVKRKPEMMDKIIAQEPIGRMGTPQEIADLVVMLCSPKSAFVVGTAMVIDGGYLA